MKTAIKLLVPLVLGGISLLWAQESKPGAAQPAPKTSSQPATVRAEARSSAVVIASPGVNTNDYNPSTDRAEAATCTKNLEKLNAAIAAYKTDKHDIPNWLFDLVPKYLADTNALVCPVTSRTGLRSAFGVLDPKIPTSYLYEFTPTAIPEVVKGAWAGPQITLREWKHQQMKLAGEEVPLVRCLLHEPALNLSVGGKVYESPVYWELNFTNSTIKLEDFSPH
jgi:hypothetical protein